MISFDYICNMNTQQLSTRILELVAKNNNIPVKDYQWWVDVYEPDLTETLPNLLEDWKITTPTEILLEQIANGDETELFEIYGESEWWWKVNEQIDSYFNKL